MISQIDAQGLVIMYQDMAIYYHDATCSKAAPYATIQGGGGLDHLWEFE